MLEVKNLEKSYGVGKNQNKVLRGVNFTIHKGEFVAVMGPSGSGKTTLLDCISRYKPFENGEILLNGKDLGKLNEKEMAKVRNEKIGFVFQDFMLLDGLTVFENVCIPQVIKEENYKQMEKKAVQLLKMFDIERIGEKYPAEISGGQKQRVAIARALVLNPKILLCDEATSALDPQITKGILALLLKINKELGITIVVVTHQMEVVKEICNKVAFLKHGKMIATGKPEELFVAPNKDVQEFVGDSVEFLPKDGVNVRLFFNDETASDSAITHLAHELGINFGICQGKLENFRGTIMGSLVINVTEADRERVTAWLTDRGILWEVLENV